MVPKVIMNNPTNLIKYFKTVRVIYQKRILNAIPFFRHTSYTKFVIISQPRVGSTLLLSYLNSHPQVIVKDEIVREKRNDQPNKNILEYLAENVYARYNRQIRAVGFKYFYEHQEDEAALLEHLMSNREIKIIHLKRGNFLNAYVSNLIAAHTGVWSTTIFQRRGLFAKKRVKIDESAFQCYKQSVEAQYKNIEDRFHNHPVFTLYYEELVERKNQSLTAVQQFLNVTDQPLITLLKKQNPEDIRDLVINFEDITLQ